MSSITLWTRLEPYTRLHDIDAGLQAAVHDPLWLLARQWQTGEFGAEDAGTPVQARARFERAPIARYRPDAGTAASSYRSDVPLEALVEREPVQIPIDRRRDLRLAAEAGLVFLQMLERAGVSTETHTLFAREPDYALRTPEDADPEGLRYLSVMAGRAPDGLRLYEALVKAGNRLPPRPSVVVGDAAKVIAVSAAFRAWFQARYSTPAQNTTGPPSWVSERMEYSFAVSATSQDGEILLSADEHWGGALDWYTFDATEGSLGAGASDPKPEFVVHAIIPAPLRYPGMAADRWWEFEDGSVNLSRVEGDADELLRMLLVHFELLYSNDWFVLPIDVTPGAVYRLRSLVVMDAFGERRLVPHYSAASHDGADWRMFALSGRDDLLFIPPVVADSLQGEPLEEVLLRRDELANLVWAVERRVPGVAGGSVDRDAAVRRAAGEATETAPSQPVGEGALRYRLATSVPENWIPFQPVRVEPQRPDVRLRRAAALIGEGDEPRFSRPQGRILEPDRPDLSLFEEEVPPSGVRVVRRYQYARWVDGSTVLWLGRQKYAGGGEASSGLRFDSVEET